MLTSGIVLLLACAAFVAYDTITFRRELAGNVSVLADAVGNNCAAAIDFNDPETAGQMLDALRAKPNMVSACVYSRDGQVLATYQRDTNAVFVPPAMQTAGEEFNGGQLLVFRPINQKGVMTGVIFVASDLKDLSARLMRRLAIAGAVFVLTLLVALPLSSRFQRLVSDPILQLARVARTVAQEKNYSLRAAKQGDDEIGDLVDGFNEMLAQIQERGAALESARDEMEMRVLKRTAELTSERRLLRTLIDNLPDIVFAKDSRSRFTLANTACARQLGTSRAEEVLGKTDADFVSPELGSQYLADEQALMQSGQPVTREEPTENRETGETRESLTTKVPLKDDAGKVVGLVGIARDITEHKRAELKLAESRNFLDRIINTVPDPIFVKDRQHRGVMVNDAFCHLMRLQREELLGKSDHDHDCFTPAQADEFQSTDELVFTMGKENINEEIITAADGTAYTVITRKALYTDEKGEKFIVGVIRDITERKQAEELLRRSQEEFKDLFDNAPVGFHEIDTEGRLVRINNTELKMLGYTAGELLGQFVWKISADEEVSRRAALAKLAGEPPSPHDFERRLRRKDGSTIPVLINDRVLKGADGAILGIRSAIQDNTERKRAEEALKREHDLLRTLIDHIPDSIYVRDFSNRFVVANESFARLMGVAGPSALIGKRDADFYPPEMAANFDKADQEVFAGNPILNRERVLRFPNGQELTILNTKVPFKNEKGEVIGLIGVGHDVTERKRTEAALAAEQRLLSSLITTIPDVVYFKDRQSRFVRINEAFARRFGLSDPSAAVGKTDFDLFGEQHAREAFADEQQIIATGEPVIDKEEREDWKDGRVKWVSSTKMPLSDKTGKIIGIMGISRDITERKRAEESLRQFQFATDHAADAIFWTKRDASFRYVNDQACRLLGYTREELMRLNLFDVDPAYSQQRWEEVWRQREQNPNATRHFEGVHRRKDGSTFPIEVMSKNFSFGGVAMSVAFVRDITERKRLEEHLIQFQKLETVGKLAGGIAHEFNSILTAIIGRAELLREDLPAGSPLAQNAIAISKSADRAAVLTRQLLAYGRRQFLRPEPLNLNQVITGMSGVLTHLMRGDSVAVSIVPAAGLKPVKADAGQIEQVIMNLAMNARDAMPGGGKLTLETSNVTLGPDDAGRYPELKPGGYVMLAISDTGRGMSEGVKARAFEPFFTTKDVGQGTGLGLSSCYGIVKQSGGHINVYSEPGRGTTFKIYLPQVESLPQIPPERLESPELPRGTETILLVEDDPALREMAATLLRRLGYTVLAAANGVEALSLKQQRDTGHVDLLLTDVVMPHMSGKELADRVRALFPHTRILFTSAYTENAIVHQGVLDKGVTLLQKPFTPSALARKVREALDAPGTPKPDPARKTSGGANIPDEAMTHGN